MVGPGSDVNLTSDTGWLVNLTYTNNNIHASHSQFSNHPGSGVNLTSESDSTLVIALFNK